MLDQKTNYEDFTKVLNENFYEMKKNNFSDFVFLCIGTDRITGDSFGPLVGQKLQEYFKNLKGNPNILVVGTLQEPFCGNNMKQKLVQIQNSCKNPYIIAIDSAVSKKEDIGKIIISKKPLEIGKAIDKSNKKIGNISIKGVVAKDTKIPKMNFTLLQNTSLNLVMNLAQQTASGIYEAIKYY